MRYGGRGGGKTRAFFHRMLCIGKEGRGESGRGEAGAEREGEAFRTGFKQSSKPGPTQSKGKDTLVRERPWLLSNNAQINTHTVSKETRFAQYS